MIRYSDKPQSLIRLSPKKHCFIILIEGGGGGQHNNWQPSG